MTSRMTLVATCVLRRGVELGMPTYAAASSERASSDGLALGLRVMAAARSYYPISSFMRKLLPSMIMGLGMMEDAVEDGGGQPSLLLSVCTAHNSLMGSMGRNPTGLQLRY